MKVLRFFRLGVCLAIAMGLTSSVGIDTSAAHPCNFSKSIDLKSTEKYGIFGNDEFDTVVCGYLVTREEKVWDDTVNMAYLRITKFAQPGFQQAIAQGIKTGNNTNAMRQGKYEFNLGCFEGTKITGEQHNKQTEYMPDRVQARLLSSSQEKPIALLLSFGKHLGRGCACCNLAHSIRMY